jgi:poly-gamma-glutamate synthesis protein (capsule biosynthesis protein)
VERYTYLMRSGERKEKLVAWSLGNFISNQDRPGTDIGLALQLKLEKDARMGKARIAEWQTIPVWRRRYRQGGRRRFSVVPALPEGPMLAGLDSLEENRMRERVNELQAFLDSTVVLH